MYLPSTTPIQYGKLARFSKSEAINSDFSLVGIGIHPKCMTDQIALHTSLTILLAVEMPILYV